MTQPESGADPVPEWTRELDASAPATLRQDITALVRKPGEKRHLRLVVRGLDGVALPSVDVESDLIDVDLTLEVMGNQCVAEGTLGAVWSGPCRRCLDTIERRVAVEVQEIFDKSPVEGETYPLEDEYVDLRPMVREALVLSLPVAPLCREACRGPAPDAFPAGTAADPVVDLDEVVAPVADPRWAALEGLSFDPEAPAEGDETSD